MSNTTFLRNGRHVVYLLHVHLVFVTKYRKYIFTKPMLDRLKTIFSMVCNNFEAILEEFDGEQNHVHLLVNYPTKVSISKLVNSLKGVSSRNLRIEYKKDISKFLYKGALWSPSYFASSCGGAPLNIVKKYIQDQNTPLF